MKFLKTISVDELKKLLASNLSLDLKTELLTLSESYNRVTSEDIISPINVPHFRKSRMDGYAVIAEDTFGAEEDNLIELELIESIHAGDIPQHELMSGKCSYVATGAAIPESATGVVMVEYSDREANKISISRAVTPGTFIDSIGHDVREGDIVVKKNKLIDLATMGILSSCGIKIVPVYIPPSVGLMSTGNEIVSHDVESLPVGKIYDVNSIVLKKALINSGAKPNFIGIIPDNYEEMKQAFTKGLEENDILVLSGGTSKGEGDLGPRVLKDFEKDIEIMVHGVRIKPGKPFIFAKLKNIFIFILPGYPTSALSCYYVFIDNFLRKLTHRPLKEENSIILEVGERIYSTIGRNEFKPVIIREIDGRRLVFPIKTGSEAISTMFKADGYIEIEELEQIIEKGDKKRVYFFS